MRHSDTEQTSGLYAARNVKSTYTKKIIWQYPLNSMFQSCHLQKGW